MREGWSSGIRSEANFPSLVISLYVLKSAALHISFIHLEDSHSKGKGMGLCTQQHGWPWNPRELASVLSYGVGAAGDIPFQLVVC